MSKTPLDKIQVDPTQKKIIEEFADTIAEETGLSILVVKGFLWKSLRNWQKEHGITINDTEKGTGSSPSERLKQAKEILAICQSKIESGTDVDKTTLSKGINNAFQHYKTQYASR